VSAEYDFSKLSPEERHELHRGTLAKLDAKYQRDIHAWLEDQVWTIDEASSEIRRWPKRDEKPYLHELIDHLIERQRPAIPKSRRMLVTWAVAAFCVHRVRYFPASAVFWQSQNVEKAAYVVGKRCAWIEDHLDDHELRRTYKAHRTSGGDIVRMDYLDTESYIIGIPQGQDAVRSFTGTILVMDEIEHQEQGREALTAALPMVEKAAKLILIGSSAGPRGVLAEICREIGFTRWA
jgi:hypothetical protein